MIKDFFIGLFSITRSWDPTSLQKWTLIRDKGLTRHIIVNGLGWFGGCLFIGVTLGTIDLANASADSPSLQRLIINNFIVCMGTGLTFGLVTWYATEYMYQKQVKAADQKSHIE